VTKRVLLDESVPRHLATPLDAAGFSTTPYPNDWKQMKNGDLLALAEDRGFDVLITSDKNIYAQQNLRGRKLSIVVLPTNRRSDVMQRASDIVETLEMIEPGQYVVIE
jgi:predicted nuclease of predicted toxin-antitoxin system